MSAQVQRPEPLDREQNRQLRIGYLSPDLVRHPCAYFLEPILRHHDRREVYVIVYKCNHGSDEVTERLRRLADEWIEVAHLPEKEIAERMKRDRVDIAVDLAGHMVMKNVAKSPMMTLAYYPAPIQVSWIGYPNTTGLDCIHYRLVDAISDPEDARQWYSEELWRLPRCFLCFAPPRDLLEAAIAPPPCIKDGHVTFGTFNNFAKTSPSAMRMWGRILAQAPSAHLKIKGMKGKLIFDAGGCRRYELDDARVEMYKERFVSIALDTQAAGFNFKSKTNLKRRVHVLPEVHEYSDHYNSYSQIDVALDPFPYGGTTTTIDALMMGVPVVSLRSTGTSSTHSQNVTAAILVQAGLSELVAETEQDYVRIALELAGDAQRLATMRATLRDKLMQSPLMDGEDAAHAVEQAFRSMWSRLLDGFRDD